MMLIGKLLLLVSRSFKSLEDMRSLMLVWYFFIFLVGQGAYGIVVAAKDKLAADKSKELVAIKKIDKAF
jgi:hypothetical protein